jgi:hypothetical protein
MRIRVQTQHGRAFWRCGIEFGPAPRLLWCGPEPPRGMQTITAEQLDVLKAQPEHILLVEVNAVEATPEERAAVGHVSALRTALDAARAEIAELTAEIAKLTAEIEGLAAERKSLTAKLKRRDAKIAELQAVLDDLTAPANVDNANGDDGNGNGNGNGDDAAEASEA